MAEYKQVYTLFNTIQPKGKEKLKKGALDQLKKAWDVSVEMLFCSRQSTET